MNQFEYLLIGEGASDEALLHVLTWMIEQHTSRPIRPLWPDFATLGRPPTLEGRIQHALALYPCDLLFVHRDADKSPREERVAEIRTALANSAPENLPAVCVIPVRMTEAWLLIDEAALRTAAGAPKGRQDLVLPTVRELENLGDPKLLLGELIRAASGLQGRRLKRLKRQTTITRLAELIDDFSALRQLSAFQALEADFLKVMTEKDRL